VHERDHLSESPFTLSVEELIERCCDLQVKAGQPAKIVLSKSDDGWHAYTDVLMGAQGSTAFEAVAKLYLALKRSHDLSLFLR
jgi:hypothetical protein